MQPDQVTPREALDAAMQVAPKCRTLVQVARLTNEVLGIEWTDAKWRGIWKERPIAKFDVEQLLGEDARRVVKTITLEGNYKGIVAGDFHVPYHDPQAIELLCKVTRWWKPDVGIINGDLNDFPGLSSKFDPSPLRTTRAQGEVDTAKRDVLIPFKAALGSNGRGYVLPGNHDNRLEILLTKQPDLFSLRATSLPELWELDRFGYGYADYAIKFGDDLRVSHGTKVASEAGYAVKGELAKVHWAYSIIMNHIHRSGGTSAKIGGKWVWGRENPCMCSLEPSYMEEPNWSLGFLPFEVRNGNVNFIPVDIYPDYTCCIAGKWFGVN